MVEFEDAAIRIEHVETKRGPNFPREHHGSDAFRLMAQRPIQATYWHHSAGGMYEGIKAVEKITNYAVAPPKYALNEDGTRKMKLVRGVERPIVVGGGRGWPGNPYTFIIPAYPAHVGGKLVLYRIWEDGWRTWHTGGVHNTAGVGICIAGWYASRHDLLNHHAHDRPTEEAMVCADHLADYLMDRYGLKPGPETMIAHAEVGKPACPGDHVENWVRLKRGEDPLRQLAQATEDSRPLETPRQIQAALIELGYDPGELDGFWGPFTANGLKAFQTAERIRADGIFGPVSRQAMRQALAR